MFHSTVLWQIAFSGEVILFLQLWTAMKIHQTRSALSKSCCSVQDAVWHQAHKSKISHIMAGHLHWQVNSWIQTSCHGHGSPQNDCTDKSVLGFWHLPSNSRAWGPPQNDCMDKSVLAFWHLSSDSRAWGHRRTAALTMLKLFSRVLQWCLLRLRANQEINAFNSKYPITFSLSDKLRKRSFSRCSAAALASSAFRSLKQQQA